MDVHLELDSCMYGKAMWAVFASAPLFLGPLPVRCGFVLIVLGALPHGPCGHFSGRDEG